MAILDTDKYKLIYTDLTAKALLDKGGITETLNDYIQHETISGLADLVIENSIDVSPLYPEKDINSVDWSKVSVEYQMANSDSESLMQNLALVRDFQESTELRVQLLRSYIQKLIA